MRYSVILSTLTPVFLAASSPAPVEDLSLASAPPYQPAKWNSSPSVKNNNNCYAYAADDIDTKEYGLFPDIGRSAFVVTPHRKITTHLLRGSFTALKATA